MRRFILAVLSAAVLAPAAHAGSSVSLQGNPCFGCQIGFLVSTHRTADPYVQVDCYQAGTLVYRETHPVASGDPWTLGPTPNWQGGPADCTATALLLQHGDLKPIGGATLNFAATG